MGRFLIVLMLTNAACLPVTFAFAAQAQSAATQTSTEKENASPVIVSTPPRPPGKSTVIGGSIQNIDRVRDQFTLKVFGGKSMKILFDGRTQVFVDGKRSPLRNLRANDHASVETILDGAKVFAVSIHVLSELPEGERQGQVMDYDAATRELTVNDTTGNGPLRFQVTPDASIVREGQAAANSQSAGSVSGLVKGSLVSVKFKSDGKGHANAFQVAILATPGSTFVFSGPVTFLDLRAKALAVGDAASDKTYKISFDPEKLPVARSLHEGQQVSVNATFDGTGYVASEITAR